MAKKAKAKLSMAEKSDKGKEQKDEMRGKIVEVGTPLWQQNGQKRHIQVKAGKMYVIDNMVHPDPRKGYICIDQDSDHVMHFCWMERDALGIKEDDLTPEPYDSIFKRVQKCTTGRVYILKIRSTNKNHFFWMQEPSVEKDTEICAKINYLLNFPPAWLRFPQIACNFKMPRSPSQSSEYDSAESNLDELGEDQLSETEDIPSFSKRGLDHGEFRSLGSLLKAYTVKIPSDTQTTGDAFSPAMRPPLDLSNALTPVSITPIMDNVDLRERLEDLLPILQDGTRDSSENSIRPKSFVAETQAVSGAVISPKLDQILKVSSSSENDTLSPDSDSEYSEVVDTGDLEHLDSQLSYVNKKASVYKKPGPSKEGEPWNCNIRKMAVALTGNFEVKFYHETTKATTEKSNSSPQSNMSVGLDVEVLTGLNRNNNQGGSSNQADSTSETNVHREIGNDAVDKWESTAEPNVYPHPKSQVTLQSTLMIETEEDNQIGYNTRKEDDTIDGRSVATVDSWQSVRCSTESLHDGTSLIDSKISSRGIILSACCVGSEGSFWKSAIDPNVGNNPQTEDNKIDEASVKMEEDVLHAIFCSQESSCRGTQIADSEILQQDISSEGSLWKSAIDSNNNPHYNSQDALRSTPMIETGNAAHPEGIVLYGKTVEGDKVLSAGHSTESPLKYTMLTYVNGSPHGTQAHLGANMAAIRVTVEKEATWKTCSKVGNPTDSKDEKDQIEEGRMTESLARAPNASQTATLGNEISSKLSIEKIPERHLVLQDLHESRGVSSFETKKSLTSPVTDDPREAGLLHPSMLPSLDTSQLDQSLPSTWKLIKEQPERSHEVNLPFESRGLDSQSGETVLTTSFTTFSCSSESGGADNHITTNEMHGSSEIDTEGNENGVTAENDTSRDDESLSNNIAMIVLVPSISSENINEDVKQPAKPVTSNINKSSQILSSGTDKKKQAEEILSSSGTVTSSSGGTKFTLVNNDHLSTQKANDSVAYGTKASESKKSVIQNQSKSLEEVIYIGELHKAERYNLRKRPVQKVGPSQSGRTVCAGVVQGCKDGVGKRPRMTSPGVPLPVPFKVPDVSPVRSSRSKHPQVRGSAGLLNSPNQEEGGWTSRKRPNEDESSDSDQEAPPTKKVRTSDGSSSGIIKGRSSKLCKKQSSVKGGKIPPGPVGSGSTPDESFNKTSCSSIVNKNSSNNSFQSTDTAPRYNLRRRSAKIEDGQQTEPVKIREIRKAGPETVVRTRTVPQVPPGPPVNRANRDRSQNTRPVIIEDRNGSKSKPKVQGPSEPDGRPKH